MLVDRAARRRPIDLEDEHGLVQPLAVGHKVVIRGGRYENIGEHLHPVRTLAVAHTVSRRDVHPFSIPFWPQQFSVRRKLRRDDLAPRKLSPWRIAFRVIRWTTYAAAIITLLMVFHAAPPPVIVTSPQAAARVEQKVEAVERAVASGQSGTLRLDQTELNSYLASHLDISPTAPAKTAPNTTPTGDANSNLPTPSGTPAEQIEQVRSSVRDVKVELVEDRVRAYVVFDFHGKDVTLQLEGRLASANGYLRFEPVSGQLGSLPIPQSALETAVQKMMDSPENREKLKLPPEIADLRIENGELLATFR